MKYLTGRKTEATSVRWLLVVYDLLMYAFFCVLLFGLNNSGVSSLGALQHILLCGGLMLICRFAARVYVQIWRYGGIQSFFRLFIADAVAFLLYYLSQRVFLPEQAGFTKCLALSAINLLAALGARMTYRYVYKCCDKSTWYGKALFAFFSFLGASPLSVDEQMVRKINLAIIGAGRNGTALAEDLLSSVSSPYEPVLFIDNQKDKAGREIHGIPVMADDKVTVERLRELNIQEVVIAFQQNTPEEQKKIYEKYRQMGCQVKTYDFPVMATAGRRTIREFDIEELLFRKPVVIESEVASNYYRGKRILITGGGGSIGSEICRQLAKMGPEQLIILDIYENGAYDIQQELRIKYGDKVKLSIEIASITDRGALTRVFEEYRPQIVIMAAAHKHVPLMEKNCIEAVKNNVFGTLNTVEISEQFGAERVIMVSTDKAVNPTNVMGATKRMCEIIVQAHSALGGKTTFSATRFGNVLGSAGSVIPLFKKQIANGGPVTITDERIIRYFMTIPEASQLVLLSGAMAKNGELFVLDMGQPVRILDLAQSMIRLSGSPDIRIIETGLRPGEKLFEELLVKSDTLQKTDNELIFIENDPAITAEELEERLAALKEACEVGSEETMREVLHRVVPTFVEVDEAEAKEGA